MPLLLSASLFALSHAQTLPLEPVHETGASVTGAFEGWFKNPDGTFNLVFGYFNRNTLPGHPFPNEIFGPLNTNEAVLTNLHR